MSRRIKMVLYGEPGTGKSVFACKAPKPFFITSDGNYEWLEEFGAKLEDHIQVNSWSEAKAAMEKSYDEYETIVVDLLEDTFKWCEQEYCIRNRIEHLSDLGYGKAYDATRTEFFNTICKLINTDKNIIFITHGVTYTTKDRRGVEHTMYAPSGRIPEKLIDQIEGRVRYFLRCYSKAEETPDGTLVKRRYLSIVPKENEFGICRGIDENVIPSDIALDWNEFCKVVNVTEQMNTGSDVQQHVEEHASDVTAESSPTKRRTRTKQIATQVETPVDVPVDVPVETPVDSSDELPVKVTETPAPSNTPVAKTETVNAPVETVTAASPVQTETMSNADKINSIKAKLAAIKSNK